MDIDRANFKKAWQLVKKGQLSAAAPLIKDLRDYPLYVYLRAAQLKPKIQGLENSALEQFLAEFGGSYPAEKLRTMWLEWLAKANHWETYLEVYRPQADVALQCHEKTALLKTHQTEGLFQQIQPLWVAGKSQPSACNDSFKFFESHAAFSDPIVWQRFRAALAQNQLDLARYVSKKFTGKKAKTWSARWLAAHTSPNQTLTMAYLQDDSLIAKDVLFHAMQRLARSNFAAAEKHWVRISAHGGLGVEDVNRGHLILANAAGKAEHDNQIFYLDQVENQYADATLEALRMRRGIQLRAWQELHRWTANPPVNAGTNALRWRYWHARSGELIGNSEKAQQHFGMIATERDYYGFMAADKAQTRYQFNDRPTNPNEEEFKKINDSPGVSRAKEFYSLGMLTDANRQWRWTTRNYSKRELELAAYAASSWGWHNRAIATLGQAKSYDDVALRFPVIFADEIISNGRKRGLDEALIFAIIRTESAFLPTARSSAGALGLMQLMPATGREAGRRIGIRINKASQLLAPPTNIAIGSSYLASLMNKYHGNFSMAAAAYNAGPHRVRQ
ncbi:MAG: transglycosylase SLT domain-containing protein, partial [Gammaproteobacteria bacterium]